MEKRSEYMVQRKEFGFRNTKKGQLYGQIFIYILALVVVSLILVYGYNTIQTFMGKESQIEELQFRTTMRSLIDKFSTEYGSKSKKEINVPSGISKVCFVSKDAIENKQSGISQKSEVDDRYPRIDDSVYSGVQRNAFLIDTGNTIVGQYDIGNITLGTGEHTPTPLYDCIPAVRGKIKVWFKGLGNGVEISEWSN